MCFVFWRQSSLFQLQAVAPDWLLCLADLRLNDTFSERRSVDPPPAWTLPPAGPIAAPCVLSRPLSTTQPPPPPAPAPLQHGAASGVTRGDCHLDVFTEQSLGDRDPEQVKQQKRKAMNYILKGKIVWSTGSQTWPHIGVIWGL